jgi:predicted RNase H-like HicB family nuclease
MASTTTTTAPRYTVIIQWSEEDQVYVVSLPEWGSGAKTHGATYEEAARNAQEVLELLMQDEPALPKARLFHYPGADVVDLPDEPMKAIKPPAPTKKTA